MPADDPRLAIVIVVDEPGRTEEWTGLGVTEVITGGAPAGSTAAKGLNALILPPSAPGAAGERLPLPPSQSRNEALASGRISITCGLSGSGCAIRSRAATAGRGAKGSGGSTTQTPTTPSSASEEIGGNVSIR